ncbi:MAG: helix-turn-helix transcriptional regulator [Oscillospiraceae bacterium]|nr:helix-turn-helix transcriptional regulator [Oscillospiraceae bacterium]
MSRLSVIIGQRIRGYRTGLKMSQEELAEKCGLHPTYIGQIERGEKNATLESISRIAGGLSIPLCTLFDKIDESTAPDTNYPAKAYELFMAMPPTSQEKLYTILEMITLL